MSWPLTVGVRAFSLPLPERKIILSGSWDWLMIIRVKTQSPLLRYCCRWMFNA